MSDIDIARDDLALDALGAGLVPDGDDEVLGLLAAFRADLEPVAVAAPNVVPLRPRRKRAGTLVGLSAAAGLILGGLTAGAVVNADQPGQLFYAAHKAVLGDPKAADRVTRLLDDAAERIAKGDRKGARDRIDKAAARLADVDDPAERALLAARVQRLRALALDPTPSATPSRDDDDRASETPEPRETESADDNSGSGSSGSDDSSGSGSSGSGSSGSGSDDSLVDSSGSGSSGSGSGDSGSSGKGSGSDDVLKTLEPDHSGSSGGGGD